MNNDTKVKVWDPLVRVFHWSLVSAFFIAYFTEEDFLSLHVWAGYTVLSLIFLRVLWGFVGTQYARFSDFVHGWIPFGYGHLVTWVITRPVAP